MARAGYLNLLQPQDRRSTRAGDPAAAIEARGRLLAAGIGSGLISRVASLVAAQALSDEPVVLDLGCGGGELLGRISSTSPGHAIGIDLTPAAVMRASKQWPDVTWVVANADRRLPILDASVDLIASVHARRNPVESARVLKPGGWLLVAVPAPDDLVELREAVFGRRVDRQRSSGVIVEHDAHFVLESHLEHREQLTLEAEQLSDLLTGTYRGGRNASREPRAALHRMTVTLASEILVLQARRR